MERPTERIVAIGDLNGAYETLVQLLRETDVIDARLRWCGGITHLIQVGDIFNRGGGARAAFELLARLAKEATHEGGRVTVLLGNHEVMTVLGNESYCTEDEYLAFATKNARNAWRTKRERAFQIIFSKSPPGEVLEPLQPQVDLWRVRNVPGRAAMRRALRPTAPLGKMIRNFPIAVIDAGCVFTHAGLGPRFASLGISGLNELARKSWKSAPKFFRELPRTSIFRDPEGPLWNRELAMGNGIKVERQLDRTLQLLGVRRMVVGHTPTGRVVDSTGRRIATRFDDKLVCIDVGLGDEHDEPKIALVIEGTRGYEWSPEGVRLLFEDEYSETMVTRAV